jgi:NADPH:quinone reductase-like Zn-dependent oxidoreductase
MRAVVTTDYGSPPTVTDDVDTSTAGPGEVRVKVRASSLKGLRYRSGQRLPAGVHGAPFPDRARPGLRRHD